MTGKHDLQIDAMLWKAASEVLGDVKNPDALKILVVAWYLDLLATDLGLSEEAEDSIAARAALPPEAAGFLQHYFTDLHDPDFLRNHLYAALVEAAPPPGRSETSEHVLGIAQVFWALSHHKVERPELPLTGGQEITIRLPDGDRRQRAHINAPGGVGDFALMNRSTRADRAKHLLPTSGSRLRGLGAKIAIQVARHIVQTTPGAAPSIDNALLYATGDERSIHWVPMTLPSTRTQPAGTALLVEGDDARALQAMVDRLTFLAEALPHEDDGALGAALLAAGFESSRSGQYNRAMTQFAEAARVSEVSRRKHADQPEHTVRLVLALTHDATARLLAGEPAEEAVERAAFLAHELQVTDRVYADLEAAVLTILGLLDMHRGDFESARQSLARAVTISTDLSRDADGDAPADFLLAHSLMGLAGVDLTSGLAAEALTSISEALVVSSQVLSAVPRDSAARFLRCSTLYVASGIYASLDRIDDALSASASAAGLAHELTEEQPTNGRALYLLATCQLTVGRCCLILERNDDAAGWLLSSAGHFEEVTRPNNGRSMGGVPDDAASLHATALLAHGALLVEAGQTDDAEASLLRAVSVVESSTDAGDRMTMLRALTTLAQLYRGTRQSALATHAERRALRVLETDFDLPPAGDTHPSV